MAELPTSFKSSQKGATSEYGPQSQGSGRLRNQRKVSVEQGITSEKLSHPSEVILRLSKVWP